MKKILIINFFIICFISTLSAQIDSSSTIKRKYFYGSFSTGVGLGYRNYKTSIGNLIKNTSPLPSVFYRVEIGKFITKNISLKFGFQNNKIKYDRFDFGYSNIKKISTTFNTNSFYFGSEYIYELKHNFSINYDFSMLNIFGGEDKFILKNDLSNGSLKYYFEKNYIPAFGLGANFWIGRQNHFEMILTSKLNYSLKTKLVTYSGSQPIYKPSSNIIYFSLGIQINSHK